MIPFAEHRNFWRVYIFAFCPVCGTRCTGNIIVMQDVNAASYNAQIADCKRQLIQTATMHVRAHPG